LPPRLQRHSRYSRLSNQAKRAESMRETGPGVLIVGGGIAAYSAAAAVAARGYHREVVLISEEDRAPYRRTKISKRLARGFTAAELELQPEGWYRQIETDLRINTRVLALDPDTRMLTLADGSELSWNILVLATGASPVIPELAGFEEGRRQGRIFTLRTAQEAERLRAAAEDRKSAIIVGAGVLGIELAEQLWRMGLRVTLVERMKRVMPADLDEETSGFLAQLLGSRGIGLHLDSRVRRLEVDRPDRVSVHTEQGRLQADILVFCLGSQPRTELAGRAGLVVQRGISVDKGLLTSHPQIYAAGDAAMHADGRVTHLWHAAEKQGEIAGANVCGEEEQYINHPFRLKMEVFGRYFFSMNWAWIHRGREETLRRRSGPVYQSFVFRDGRLAGVVMVDDKPRAQLYKQAVLERHDKTLVDQGLSL